MDVCLYWGRSTPHPGIAAFAGLHINAFSRSATHGSPAHLSGCWVIGDPCLQ